MSFFEKEINLTVRYNEIDAMGIAHHSNYFIWLELLRISWLLDKGINYKKLEESGYYLPLTQGKIEYIKALYFNDKINIKSNIFRLSKCKIAFKYEIFKNNQLTTKCSTHHVMIDKNHKIVRFPIFIEKIIPKLII